MFMVFDHTLFSAGPRYDKHPSHGWAQIIERYEWSEDNGAELAKGWIKTADSIAALASVTGLDAAETPTSLPSSSLCAPDNGSRKNLTIAAAGSMETQIKRSEMFEDL